MIDIRVQALKRSGNLLNEGFDFLKTIHDNFQKRGIDMSKTQALNTAQTHNKLLDANKDLIRIIGTALYPARKQLELLQEAREEIRNMKLEGRTSYELKVQEKAIAWEKSLLSRNR